MITSLLLAALSLTPVGHAPDCAAALRIVLPDAQVTAAIAVPANDSLRALGQKPHCRVEATIDTETHIVALLPDDWNGRFLMGGAGGYVGAVENQSEMSVHEGYATVGTDAGHRGFGLNAEWALGHDQRVVDYGHRAVHRTAVVTKALIVAYYGRPPERSYFIGCSNGGRQALMEAQRYPEDFDGIVAIAPWINPLEWSTAAVHNLKAQYPTGNFAAPVVTPAVLGLLASKVIEKCDTIDGVRDGVMENPDECRFSLASLPACVNDAAKDGCVTAAQRAALRAFIGPLTAGTLRYPGWPHGDEADPAGWEAWMTGPVPSILEASGQSAPTVQGMVATQFFKYLVYGDSAWRYTTYDLARAARDGARVNAIVSPSNPDLAAFHARGGKLLLAHGWSDPALSARATIDYFKVVQQRTPLAASFTRLFLMPGVLHCGGGSGCDDVNWTTLIRGWVEQGEAPARVVARKLQGTAVVRTHPLCAYPMTARYNGSGSIDDAASFACR
jgi:feruloyl esterase